MIGKPVTGAENVFKKDEKTHLTFKNEWLPLHFMLWNGSGKPIEQVISFLVARKSYLDCVLAKPKESCQGR